MKDSCIWMPTSNAYIEACETSLKLLAKYWPACPRVDVTHFESRPDLPGNFNGDTICLGTQSLCSWTQAAVMYLERHAPEFVLIFLDDYGLTCPPNVAAIDLCLDAMKSRPKWLQCSLTWQPCPKKDIHGFDEMIPWDYSLNTQAGIWRTADILQCLKACDQSFGPWQIEVAMSKWWNANMYTAGKRCVSWRIPEPPNPSGFVDSVDKTHWLLNYRNLVNKGAFDERHREWLEKEFA